MLIYHAKIWKHGKFYLAEIKELGLLTQGFNKKDAELMIEDALKEYLQSAKEYDYTIPLPKRKKGSPVGNVK